MRGIMSDPGPEYNAQQQERTNILNCLQPQYQYGYMAGPVNSVLWFVLPVPG